MSAFPEIVEIYSGNSDQRSSREYFDQDEFDKVFGYHMPVDAYSRRKNFQRFLRRYYEPFLSSGNFLRTMCSFFPILNWLPKYDIKRDLLYDAIGGFTVGVMHIPQGIAYSRLANVSPVAGLYISFFPALFYFLFGTSQHNSIGSFAVVSLMSGSVIDRFANTLLNHNIEADMHKTLMNKTPSNHANFNINSDIACSLTLSIGLIHVIMGVLRLEFMAAYFSDQVVNGFTTAAAFHVFIAQLPAVFGLKGLPRRSGFGQILLKIGDVCTGIPNMNWFVLGMSVISMIFLFIGKGTINPFLRRKFVKLIVPLPFELVLMLIATVLSAFFDFNNSHGVETVGEIPVGLPALVLPNFSLIPLLAKDALAIAAVIVAIHISLAKMFANRHKYTVSYGQEFYAIGFTSFLSSFFPVFPPACALGRTLVNSNAGSRTQVSSVFSSIVVLSVILYLGQFLNALPQCVLGAIVIVALKDMVHNFNDLKFLWATSLIDFVSFDDSETATTPTHIEGDQPKQ